LEELSQVVPDGMVVFLTSYSFLETMVRQWDTLGVLKRVLNHKLIFIETKDVVETTLALNNFKAACDSGRGAIFLSVARGKVAEGIDFNGHYGRAVLLFGVPYQYTKSRVLLSRLQFLESTHRIKEADFLMFDAVRQCAQCVGRVIRSKQDYGIMVFADNRFNNYNVRSKLPQWVTQCIEDHCRNLSTEMATTLASGFLKDMAQPQSSDGKGVSYFEEDDIERNRARAQAAGMLADIGSSDDLLGDRNMQKRQRLT
jgi:DNA excision repair protein ERCC-2